MKPFDDQTLPKQNILCVDMRSFYASCAALQFGLNPMSDYLAVVGDQKRQGSVVLAATPPLKRDYGIKTGSRLFEIPKHEKIFIVRAEMEVYLRISVEITRLFNKYVPRDDIHTYSVDESFLVVDGVKNLWGEAENVASLILTELKETFGLSAAVGIGPNMLMAKLCLDLEAKQKGIARWTYDDIPKKLWPVSPLSKMWGIGSRLEKRLNRIGIYTVGQLAHYPLTALEKKFGVIGNQLYYHANGIDLSKLQEPILYDQLSYSKNQVLLRDYRTREAVAVVILEMSEEVGKRARVDQKLGRTISLGIKYSKHEGGGGFQRSKTIAAPTNLTMEIYETCMYLFDQFYNQKTVRQISISLTNLVDDASLQLKLFHNDRIQERTIDYTVDQIRQKYGTNSLLRAISYTDAGTKRERSKLIGGHHA